MTVNKTDTFVQITKHLHTQQLTEKATGHTNQILKYVPYARCLKNFTKSKNRQKVITRHVWEDHKKKDRQNRLSVSGKNLYKKRKNRAKLSDSKQLHGLHYYRLRGKRNVSEQVLLTAACQNMKKIATYLAKQG
ncbi:MULTISPECIES: transposase [unclassified Bacillus (in: firmicutes)]|uniref:transposase n=1 Tax=Bacillus sp. X2(2017) TaxID=2025586 RepID=UPI000BA87F87|nr:hypothetical protein CIK44_07210 [Bacillus sp. X2(2017)]POO80465.1 hypothetical protein C1T30_24000 [Bacillus sp. MBGLi97]